MSELFLVTGATGGLGQHVAREIAERGGVPVIGYRPERAEVAAALAHACGGSAVELDMADAGSIDSAVEALVADGRPVAGVVLAASPPPVMAPFGRIGATEHALFWTANVTGPHQLLAQLLRRCFRVRRRGSVVAVLSSAMGAPGRPAIPGMGAYVVSKFGLAGVLALLEAECRWLRVSTVSPGFLDTPMFERFDARFRDAVRARGDLAAPATVAKEIVDRLPFSEAEALDVL